LLGNIKKSRSKKQTATSDARSCTPDGGTTIGTLLARDYKGVGNQDLKDGRGLVLTSFDRQRSDEYGTDSIASTISARDYKSATDLVVYENHANDSRVKEMGDNQVAVAHTFKNTADCLTAAYGRNWNGNASATNGSLFAHQNMAVRRLTPVECERLQGFPDNYTNIPWRKKSESPDGPRYKAMGNSMAVPVMKWIGQRISEIN
jgi:DNA (cytosine-5)-methyltransferase 1